MHAPSELEQRAHEPDGAVAAPPDLLVGALLLRPQRALGGDEHGRRCSRRARVLGRWRCRVERRCRRGGARGRDLAGRTRRRKRCRGESAPGGSRRSAAVHQLLHSCCHFTSSTHHLPLPQLHSAPRVSYYFPKGVGEYHFGVRPAPPTLDSARTRSLVIGLP